MGVLFTLGALLGLNQRIQLIALPVNQLLCSLYPPLLFFQPFQLGSFQQVALQANLHTLSLGSQLQTLLVKALTLHIDFTLVIFIQFTTFTRLLVTHSVFLLAYLFQLFVNLVAKLLQFFSQLKTA